jgi:hypothetical protein
MEAHHQEFYDIVAGELRSRFIVDGLWVRAFSDAGGDEAKAKAIYIAYRVEQLKAEALAAKAAAVERAQAVAMRERERERRDRLEREEEEKRARVKEAVRQNQSESDSEVFTIAFWVTFGVIFFLLIVAVATHK